MIDKITAKIKKFPFQTGILIGVLACLLLVGFINLFQDNGRSLSGNTEIVREDYLRMAINAFGENGDAQLAAWRYKHLGRSADSTLELMAADETIPPQLLSSFAEAVGKKEMLQKKINGAMNPAGGTPANPRKGLSGFGKTILVILVLIVLAAAGFYVASLIKTKQKQKRRAEYNQSLANEPLDVITPEKARMTDKNVPDTLFDLDSLFPQNPENDGETSAPDMNLKDLPDLEEEEPAVSAAEEDEAGTDTEKESTADEDASEPSEAEPEEVLFTEEAEDGSPEEPDDHEEADSDDDVPQLEIKTKVYDFSHDFGDEEEAAAPEPVTPEEAGEGEEPEEAETEAVPAELSADEEPEEEPSEIEAPENQVFDEQNVNAEKPLVETDKAGDPDSEDELLKMIRGTKTTSALLSDLPEQKTAEPEESAGLPAGDPDFPAEEAPAADEAQEDANDILMHYQSSYRVGNDMYDEVFSIDQGDTFRGECGIGIGETLNNTEPKAVTAFEVWLFDKDDIHTATWYLMSDFAMNNEGISERLQQHGRCERIRKNGTYQLETETLIVEVRVTELEYGIEMEEKNSYFTNVTFDVVARSKQSAD